MFKVRCTLVEFVGDEKNYPCHFNYKIGDEIYYDGERFTGRVCPGMIIQMMPVVHGIFLVGHKYTENILYRYRGRDMRDLSMAKYDGQGFRPLKTSEATHSVGGRMAADPKSGKARGGHFLCGDNRTLAHFACEAVDLSDSDYAQPFFRREIAILEKIEAEPGIKVDKILDRFTDFEKNDIAPPLTPIFLQVLLEALSDMNYIEVRQGAAYATGKAPPSRPKIG